MDRWLSVHMNMSVLGGLVPTFVLFYVGWFARFGCIFTCHPCHAPLY
jgi:hypothetical protein